MSGTNETPEGGAPRNASPGSSGLDVSDFVEGEARIPCLGCGQRDCLLSVIQDKPDVLWCRRCGTIIDTETRPIEALVPRHLVDSLKALGVAGPTSAHQKAIVPPELEADPSSSQPPTPEATPPPH